MPLLPLSQAYRVTPRRDVARPAGMPALPPTLPLDPDTPSPREREPRDRDTGRQAGEPAGHTGGVWASARRSPLMQALAQALAHTLGSASVAVDDLAFERALIAFARALNHATHDVGAQSRPSAVRADEAARRRAQHEAQLLSAFGALLHTAGRAASPGPAPRAGRAAE